MTPTPNSIDPAELQLKDFEDMLTRCQQAAEEGDLTQYRSLDHQLRNMAIAMIGGMPNMQPGDDRYISALREAVLRLGSTAGEIQKDHNQLKSRKQKDQKIRLAYARPTGQA